MEAFSDNTVNIGKFGVYPIKVAATGTLAVITGSMTGSLTGSVLGSSTSASFASTSSYVNPLRQNLLVTGSLDTTGTIRTGVGYGNFTTYSPDGNFGAAYVGEETKAAIVTVRNAGSVTYAGVTIPGFSSALVLGTSYGYNVGTGNHILSVGDLNIRVNNTTQALYANTSGQIGIKYSGSLSANLQVRGSGTTNSTTTLLIENANASASLEVKDDRSVTVSGILTANSSSTIAGPLTVNYGGVVSGTSIYANGNTIHNQGRGIYTTGYAYGIQANQTMVGNWSDQPNAAGVHGTGQIGVYGSGSIAGFSGPSAFFTVLTGDSRGMI